jgi:hypothetical protein
MVSTLPFTAFQITFLPEEYAPQGITRLELIALEMRESYDTFHILILLCMYVSMHGGDLPTTSSKYGSSAH